MTILPLHPAENASPDALRAFLEQCRGAAKRAGRPQLVSISLAVDALDPLAVLESIFEPDQPHFYAERPSAQTAIAGAEVATGFSSGGADRFAEVQAWVDETLSNTIAVGDVSAPFGGPHFFSAFTFTESDDGSGFPAANVFVPKWQVARAGDVTTAVANLVIAPDADLAPLAERVWRAHGKFRRFEYQVPDGSGAGTTRAAAPDARARGADNRLEYREVGDFRVAVARALERIEAGALKKIVLARAQDVIAGRPFHPLEMLNGLRERFPDCYAFSHSPGRGSSFIGATPERLVRVSQGVLETEALAGSIRRGVTASEDAALGAALLQSEKDVREQRQVLDDIVARLKPLGISPEHSEQPQLRKLANVQHLQTVIRANVPGNVRTLDLVAAMHPTPAVGGYPRRVAVPLIRELEGFPRGLYAGALGWLNARDGGEFFVGIRSALVEQDRARVYAGAGIVAGSTPEKEFAETDLKFAAVLNALLM